MLKEQARLLNKIMIAVDFAAVFAAFGAAYLLFDNAIKLEPFQHYLWIMLVVMPIWYFLLARFWVAVRTSSIGEILAGLLKVHALGGIITSSIIYLVDPHGFSRGLFGTFLLFSYLILITNRIFLKLLLGYIRKLGYNYRNILIVGTEEKAWEFIRVVETHTAWGLKIIGIVQLPGDEVIPVLQHYPVVGTLDDVVSFCKKITVDEVVFCLTKESLFDIEECIHNLQEMGVTTRMVLDFYEAPRSRTELTLFHGSIPMLTFYSNGFRAEQLLLKRCLDILGALVGLLLTSLLFPIIALAIKFDSRGPIFFGQQRVGVNGRIFTCWKFRSMLNDAEERKEELIHLNEMKGAIFKIKNDPRITKVGTFLRKTSLDELPQFWNVLRGDMSMVGTRPPTSDEVSRYENWHRRRICIKPGITGLWQVSGRNEIRNFDEVVRLDLEYIDRWTLWLDLKILVRTFWVVFARSGA